MKTTRNLQLLNQVNEASAQLIGAINDGDWVLAQQLSTQRQATALQIVLTDEEATTALADAWERYRRLEHELEAALKKYRQAASAKQNVSTSAKARKNLKHYQSPKGDQTD
ncbi:hypothetical protein [Simiduia agarivorans]|uniref:Flagellar protein FliT n=1 Tax=Simiduia agarivorans (strain DSM 21679 / JCM 13881 / BCRC 17597 / SA1) TaxID=1117647 RepID=K4KFH2_SIMAS|nr:hypothetical protein [Simiduia agarivorans]AFU97671.1 hypothetical protein M5M_02260 [Simiduia agarivorans SA1 = DSM 21679]